MFIIDTPKQEKNAHFSRLRSAYAFNSCNRGERGQILVGEKIFGTSFTEIMLELQILMAKSGNKKLKNWSSKQKLCAIQTKKVCEGKTAL